MNNLIIFFKDIIKNKASWTNSKSGKEFEDRIINELKRLGFSRGMTSDMILNNYLKKIKSKIITKVGTTIIDNDLGNQGSQYIDMFVWQPFGSQNYPDFLIFTKNKIYSIEIKYSSDKAKKPMWNSNLPKKDGIYIFGSYGYKDITFFRGENILPNEEREILVNFWEKTDAIFSEWKIQYKEKFNKKEVLSEYGFIPYIRKAFDQGKSINESSINDFFDNKKRVYLEESVLLFIEDTDK